MSLSKPTPRKRRVATTLIGVISALMLMLSAQLASSTPRFWDNGKSWHPGWCQVGEGVAVVVDWSNAPKAQWPKVAGANAGGYVVRCLNATALANNSNYKAKQTRFALAETAGLSYKGKNDWFDTLLGLDNSTKDYWMSYCLTDPSAGKDPKKLVWSKESPWPAKSVNQFCTIIYSTTALPVVPPQYAKAPAPAPGGTNTGNPGGGNKPKPKPGGNKPAPVPPAVQPHRPNPAAPRPARPNPTRPNLPQPPAQPPAVASQAPDATPSATEATPTPTPSVSASPSDIRVFGQDAGVETATATPQPASSGPNWWLIGVLGVLGLAAIGGFFWLILAKRDDDDDEEELEPELVD